jgi:hypothetical protein
VHPDPEGCTTFHRNEGHNRPALPFDLKPARTRDSNVDLREDP